MAKKIKAAYLSKGETKQIVASAIKGLLADRRLVRRRRGGRGEQASFWDFSSGGSSAVYRGARKSIHNADWLVSGETADSELVDSLPILRPRCRQLSKDNGIAEGALLAYKGMTVGEGPHISSNFQDEAARQQVQDIIDRFCDNCDITGEKNITDFLDTIVDSSCTDGDILINTPLDLTIPSGKVQTRLQLIEADRVDTPLDKTTDENNPVRHGVCYNTLGKVIGYYVKKLNNSQSSNKYVSSISGTSNNYQFYNKMAPDGRRLTWLFRRPGAILRPGQSRQTPLFTSCLDTIKDMEDLLDAHIIGTRAAACIMAFIKAKDPEGLVSGITYDEEAEESLTDKYGQKYSRLQPASILPLREGEDIEFLDPKRDPGSIDPVILRMAKFISMKLRIPYAILFLDLSEINYSSYRGGILESRRMFKRFRSALTKEVLNPIFQTVITEAWLKGLIPAARTLAPELFNLRVDFPAWGYIDIEKEVAAESDGILNGLTSHQKAAAEKGEDWKETLMDRIKYEVQKQALETEYNVKLPESSKIVTSKNPATNTSGGVGGNKTA